MRLDDERALVLTTDFFTPIVDDPYDWGRIAAANALSDVYAMGGRPAVRAQPGRLAGRGARPRACSARCCGAAPRSRRRPAASSLGGHTIDDPEPKYGLAVIGVVHPDRLIDHRPAPRPATGSS